MIKVSTSKCAKMFLIPAIAAGLTLGVLRTSQAQSSLFTNTDTLGVGPASTTVPATGATYTRPFGSGDSYFINSAGSTDNSLKDAGQGIGADIRLTVAGNGIRLVSNQNSIVNIANDTYTFYTTIADQASGKSGVLYTQFILNTVFNEGNSNTSATLVGYGSVQGGVLSGNSLTLGNDTYSASNFSFTPPSAPPNGGGQSSTDGAFSEHIIATVTSNTPEPGAVATLVGMGITGSTFLLRRKRK